MRRLSLAGVFAAAALGLAGCGGSDRVPVTGTVTLDGQPLADAGIVFHPVGGGDVATASADASGRFSMGTLQAGDGVRPGKYKVTIDAVDKDAPRAGHPADGFRAAQEAANKPVDPAKELRKQAADAAKALKKKPKPEYGDPQKTPYEVTVPGQQELKLELTSTPPAAGK